jgi:superoxide reductase
MSNPLFWRMNTEAVSDDKALGEKHAPVIEFPDGMEHGKPAKVRVHIGNGKHPNLNEHFIQWIELRVNDLYVARAEFSPIITEPDVTFTFICPEGPIEISAVSRCNLHGLWQTKVQCPCCG